MIAPRKALFIQLRRIGDILMCTPAIRAFRKHYPDCRIEILTEIPDVLKGNPYIDSVIAVDHSREFNFAYQYNLIRKIRSARYDLVIDYFTTARSAYYSFLSGAATRLSYGYGHRKWAYNLTPKKENGTVYAATDRLNLLRAIDVPSDGFALNFYPSESDREEARQFLHDVKSPLVTISPVSRRDYRRWPLEKFAELAAMIKTRFDTEVLVISGPGENEFADKVVELSNLNIKSLCLKSLGVLGAIFEKSSLHIGNDNGPKHIVVACGVPTITIFGPDSAIGWTYPDPSRHQYIVPSGLCDDCRRKKRSCQGECIRDISVESVWEKVELMAGSLPGLISVSKKS